MQAHDITVDGRRVHFLVAGTGPPLLLLHAVGESSASWRTILPALAAGCTAYAPDLPGFGASAPLGSPPTPEGVAAAMAAFLEAVAEGREAAVVGSSFGGAVALRLALDDPGRVARLVLVDSAGLGRAVHPALCTLTITGYGDLAAWAATTPLGSAQRAWLRLPLLFRRPELAPPDWVEEQHRLATLPGHMRATMEALRAQLTPLGQRRVLLDALPQLDLPTLLVWGAEDLVFPLAQAEAATARLPRGRLEVIPQCGHLPHLERPERFIAALDRFFAA